jgi:hypothetical protein
MICKDTGTQPRDKTGPTTVAASWDKQQSTSTAHKQPRYPVGKGK